MPHLLPTAVVTLHVKLDEIDSHVLAWWDGHPVFTVCVGRVVEGISGTYQRVIKRVKTSTSYQRKNM